MRPRVQPALLVLCSLPWPVLLSCGSQGGPAPSPERGDLVSISRTATLGAAQIAGLVSPWDAEAAKLAVHGVDIHAVVYVTQDQHGDLVQASGALMVPATSAPVPTVSIQHGTVTLRSAVASVSPQGTTEGVVGLLMASAGYLACLPDYQGFGVSVALHPYVHARSLSAAVVDFLLAAEEAAPGLGAHPDGRLFLAGYSEGGYATLATHREIEARYRDRFQLVASAPMAGPYDLSGTARSLLEAESYPYPAYLAFVLTAYDDAYGWHRLGDIFRDPYAAMLPGLFDGTHDFGSVNALLPTSVSELLREEFVQGFLDGSEAAVVQAFAENDLLAWTPIAPIRLYHGDADDAVPYQNALAAVESLSSLTNSVELVTIPGGTHESAGLPALLGMIRWFAEQ
jgi:fermentation-respiration switch protein FrsA (DUF1100 family)